jgi:hypothetical protein
MAASSTFPYLEQITDRTLRDAFKWVALKLQFLERTIKGENQGTLQPDQRPGGARGLAAIDAGTKFFSTDYARAYVWTGTSWVDAPDAPTRFSVSFFPASPEPPVGWAICDGRNVLRSTNAASVELYTTPVTPDYSGLKAWIRL